ncbi:hypothetical protein [Micromonospora aurantiaca (nom. illeg.)]|uniref:hypothetical protein n=1 Tax=Micromonospora aurantiaca (nom. illeg.) TaxID=47850 RepID=UPI003401775A
MGDLISTVWRWLHSSNPDAWAAAAGWTTATVAVVAAMAAFRQVREARKLREEQAQPYVVAYMEASPASEHIIDLVVKNFGTTVARNVRITSNPRLLRSGAGGEKVEEVALFDVLPVLVPGQEWRTFWDSGISRSGLDAPDKYEIEVTYQNSKGDPMDPTLAILDWAFYKSRIWTEVYGVHHAAKHLKEISKNVKKWSEFGGGLKVYARDGDEKDARRSKDYEEWRSRHEVLKAQLLPQQPQGSTAREDADVLAVAAAEQGRADGERGDAEVTTASAASVADEALGGAEGEHVIAGGADEDSGRSDGRVQDARREADVTAEVRSSESDDER